MATSIILKSALSLALQMHTNPFSWLETAIGQLILQKQERNSIFYKKIHQIFSDQENTSIIFPSLTHFKLPKIFN